uniref:MULE domain-containing protein n=1 Tax=Globodera pallida TaxID=36090 RepID=A0A183BRN2_GLOPA
MSPKGIFQVYRVFGFVGQTHAIPLVTALMRGKTGAIYNRFWTKLRDELNGVPGDLQTTPANFDSEPALVNAFCVAFPEVHSKMCVFHVKQAINRRIQRMGYMELYSSSDEDGMEFQRIVRKIGALQFCPPNYIRRSLHLIRNQIDQTTLEIAQKAALNEILDYYEVSHAEEETAVAIDEGRQPPPRPFALTEEINGDIASQKVRIINFLNTDIDEDEFTEAMSQYYGRIGHLIGFNPVHRAEVEEIIMDESARELAEASLDENGLLAALSDVEGDENVAPAQVFDDEVDVVNFY